MAAKARSSTGWTETARKAEALGYSTLVMPDHFGDQLSPIPALAAAAAVTETLRVGTLVFCNDFRHPAVLAKETATLDLLSDGRLEVGVGAGWMTEDYTWTGITHDRAGVRIDRMIEAVEVLRGLWGDEAFTFDGDHYTITDMNGMPKPVQAGGPPIVVGGGASGCCRPRPGSPTSSVSTPTSGRASSGPRPPRRCRLTPPTRSSAGCVRPPAIGSTTSRSASSSSSRSSPTIATGRRQGRRRDGHGCGGLLASPHMIVGSAEQIVDELVEQRERWQGSYVTVQSDALEAFAPVVAALAGT